jgi:hypothetical protein
MSDDGCIESIGLSLSEGGFSWYFKRRKGSYAPIAVSGSPLTHDPLSSKDLLEACVVFVMAPAFVMAFRLKK